MQVDWISGYAKPQNPAYHAAKFWEPARFLRINPEGEVEGEHPTLTRVEGSYSSSFQWGSQTGNELYLTGNPVKFLQGHNLFGSDNLRALFFAVGATCRQAGTMPFPGPQTWQANDLDLTVTRADLTRSYRFPDQKTAEQWIREAAASAHAGRLQKDLTSPGTVYFGKRSRRWSLKMYLKAPEMRARGKGHRLPSLFASRRQRRLLEWAEGVVRFEICLRGMEIRDNPEISLDKSKILSTWSHYFDRIQFNRNAEAVNMSDITEADLKPAERSCLTLWRLGTDPRETFPKRTWYRHRRRILDLVGVDIAEPAPKEEAKKVTKLEPSGWDPEPIESEMYDPEPVAEQYRLKAVS